MMKKWQKLWSKSSSDGIEDKANTSHLLIDGQFSPLEAADILLSLLNDKIKFHSVQMLNAMDPSSEIYVNSEKRIKKLRETKQEITELILKARKEGQHLKIYSTIQITNCTP
ncbi:hypothetical protein [Flagellimonas flava]|uniref:hypothetical protein n=1 Tax=Flagellimonas flava TaxID=570519 RepID=UPI003D660DE7